MSPNRDLHCDTLRCVALRIDSTGWPRTATKSGADRAYPQAPMPAILASANVDNVGTTSTTRVPLDSACSKNITEKIDRVVATTDTRSAGNSVSV